MGRGSSGIGGGGAGRSSSSNSTPTVTNYENSVSKKISNLTDNFGSQVITLVDPRGNEREVTLNITPVYDPADRTTVIDRNYTVVYENKGINPGQTFSMSHSTLKEAKDNIKDDFLDAYKPFGRR